LVQIAEGPDKGGYEGMFNGGRVGLGMHFYPFIQAVRNPFE
jgi:hypothetical protein